MAEYMLSYAKETLNPDTYNLLQEFIDWDNINKHQNISESFIYKIQNMI